MRNEDTLKGFALAATAYVLWGFMPIYMKALAHVPATEVLVHRVIWSVPVAGVVLLAMGRTGDLRAALRSPRTIGMAAVTAALVSVNWGIYVWAISAGQTLDAALGYYINPLFSVLLGAVLLRERLGAAQMVAIGLAFAAVALLTIGTGRLPVVAIGLTLSWGIYAYCKKMLPIGPNQGFLLEVLLLLPFALAWLGWLTLRGDSHFLAGNGTDTALLLGCGIVTAVPLLFYANGAKLLRLSTIGVLQYIVPTMVFFVAVFLFDEPFDRIRLIAFAMIWTALVLYTGAMLRGAQNRRAARSGTQRPGDAA